MDQLLKGIIPPMVTPLLDDDILDVAGLERLIEYLIGGGVHGLFILGTTGEAPNLSYRLRRELIRRTCEQVAQRVPVLVGITDTSFKESVQLAEIAAESGAAAVVSATPYYYRLQQSQLITYFTALTKALPLPLFLYNMPGMTKICFDPATVREIAENQQIIGLKDSSGDAVYGQRLLYTMKDRSDFHFFVGPDIITAETVLMGGSGGVNGGANLFPKLYVRMYEAAVNRNFEVLLVTQGKIRQLWSTLLHITNSDASHLTGIKAALSIIGICNSFVATPFRKLTEKEMEQAQHHLEALDYRNLI